MQTFETSRCKLGLNCCFTSSRSGVSRYRSHCRRQITCIVTERVILQAYSDCPPFDLDSLGTASPEARFKRLNSSTDSIRDRTWVMLRAFSQYLEGEGRNIRQEADGLASLDGGEGINLDEVLEEVEEIIKRTETKHAGMRAG
ncbi:hypothetical protein [Methylopila sp. M107]|uniref:CopG family ribbon-helix-helix protein n=1 Tax=Methylopila sp. M107 TaxID=1101190 RepID=UPI0012DC43D4|nr:hypothetical protein [Methylopila sp. M107]